MDAIASVKNINSSFEAIRKSMDTIKFNRDAFSKVISKIDSLVEAVNFLKLDASAMMSRAASLKCAEDCLKDMLEFMGKSRFHDDSPEKLTLNERLAQDDASMLCELDLQVSSVSSDFNVSVDSKINTSLSQTVSDTPADHEQPNLPQSVVLTSTVPATPSPSPADVNLVLDENSKKYISDLENWIEAYLPDIPISKRNQYAVAMFVKNMTTVDRVKRTYGKNPGLFESLGFSKFDATDAKALMIEKNPVARPSSQGMNALVQWMKVYAPDIGMINLNKYAQLLLDNDVHTVGRLKHVIDNSLSLSALGFADEDADDIVKGCSLTAPPEMRDQSLDSFKSWMADFAPDVPIANLARYCEAFNSQNVHTVNRLKSAIKNNKQWIHSLGLNRMDADDIVIGVETAKCSSHAQGVDVIKTYLISTAPNVPVALVGQYAEKFAQHDIVTVERLKKVIVNNRTFLEEIGVAYWDATEIADALAGKAIQRAIGQGAEGLVSYFRSAAPDVPFKSAETYATTFVRQDIVTVDRLRAVVKEKGLPFLLAQGINAVDASDIQNALIGNSNTCQESTVPVQGVECLRTFLRTASNIPAKLIDLYANMFVSNSIVTVNRLKVIVAEKGKKYLADLGVHALDAADIETVCRSNVDCVVSCEQGAHILLSYLLVATPNIPISSSSSYCDKFVEQGIVTVDRLRSVCRSLGEEFLGVLGIHQFDSRDLVAAANKNEPNLRFIDERTLNHQDESVFFQFFRVFAPGIVETRQKSYDSLIRSAHIATLDRLSEVIGRDLAWLRNLIHDELDEEEIILGLEQHKQQLEGKFASTKMSGSIDNKKSIESPCECLLHFLRTEFDLAKSTTFSLAKNAVQIDYWSPILQSSNDGIVELVPVEPRSSLVLQFLSTLQEFQQRLTSVNLKLVTVAKNKSHLVVNDIIASVVTTLGTALPRGQNLIEVLRKQDRDMKKSMHLDGPYPATKLTVSLLKYGTNYNWYDHGKFGKRFVDARYDGKLVALRTNDGYVGIEMRKELLKMVYLVHPNIVTFLASGDIGGKHFWITELAQCTLHEVVKGGTRYAEYKVVAADAAALSVEWKLAVLLDVCKALRFIHSKDVAHRGLCLYTVLIFWQNGSTVAKLTDFGLYTVEFPSLCSQYRPPEGYDTRTVEADIFSLGIIAWELMTMISPWREKDDQGTINAIRNGDRPPKDKWRVSSNRLEIELQRIVGDASKGCLAARPVDRPTAVKVCECLQIPADNLSNATAVTSTSILLETDYLTEFVSSIIPKAASVKNVKSKQQKKGERKGDTLGPLPIDEFVAKKQNIIEESNAAVPKLPVKDDLVSSVTEQLLQSSRNNSPVLNSEPVMKTSTDTTSKADIASTTIDTHSSKACCSVM